MVIDEKVDKMYCKANVREKTKNLRYMVSILKVQSSSKRIRISEAPIVLEVSFPKKVAFEASK